MLEYIERLPTGKPRALMVWLHGLGADAYDLEPVAGMLEMTDIHHVFPHAPVRPVTLNGGMAMRAWYDIAGADLRWREDGLGMTESAKQVQALIATVRGTSNVPVVLAGFSQGAVISLMTAANGKAGLSGVAALSGYAPQALAAAPDILQDLAIFMAHGSQDEIIPIALAQHGRDALIGLGANVSWHAYDMPHSICQQEIVELADWLSAVV